MEIELLKDCKLSKSGLKKKKGMQFIVHQELGIKLISDKKAKKVSGKSIFNVFKLKK